MAVGVEHLVPVEDQVPFWLAAGLDVLLVLGGAVLLVLYLGWTVLRFLFGFVWAAFFGRRTRQRSDKKKTN